MADVKPPETAPEYHISLGECFKILAEFFAAIIAITLRSSFSAPSCIRHDPGIHLPQVFPQSEFGSKRRKTPNARKYVPFRLSRSSWFGIMSHVSETRHWRGVAT